ncbi:hypothetical protein Hdeb2414_s0001g00005101 [Helianthus debilis subsp. tardiflorus]
MCLCWIMLVDDQCQPVTDELDTPSAGEELIMLVPRTPVAALSMINTSAVECNAGNAPHQSAAFYLSVLANLFPGLLPLAKEVLRETGYTVKEVTEDTAAQYHITLQGWIDVSTALAIFGQFALVIYKNIDDRSYTRSMQCRAAAIKNVAGVVGDLVPSGGDILLSVSTAKSIRTIVGRHSNFRAGLVKIILANRDGMSLLNSVCNHLAEIIGWTERQVMNELDGPSAGLSHALRQFEGGKELIMLVQRSPDATPSMIHTSAVECNAGHAPHQSAAFYLSALAMLFPTLLPLAKELLQETGYTVEEVTEDTAAPYLITLQGWIDNRIVYAIFAQLALVIYKNIDNRSYERFMLRRAAAIKSFAGVCDDLMPGGGDILLSISTAKNIRTIVGANGNFRAGLLTVILGNRDGWGRLNGVCNYLAEIISWTEMAPLQFMLEALCLTDSPVLRDSRVKHEVINLCEAYKRINETPYPQYFRIMHPTEARVTIAKSRFPTLAEVARRYLSELKNRVSQFAASSNGQNTLVNNLLSIHRAHITRLNRDGAYLPKVQGDDDISRAIRFLTTHDIDKAIRYLTTELTLTSRG